MVARITTAIVAIFGFLFPFTALRDGVLALIGKDAKASRAYHAGLGPARPLLLKSLHVSQTRTCITKLSGTETLRFIKR